MANEKDSVRISTTEDEVNRMVNEIRKESGQVVSPDDAKRILADSLRLQLPPDAPVMSDDEVIEAVMQTGGPERIRQAADIAIETKNAPASLAGVQMAAVEQGKPTDAPTIVTGLPHLRRGSSQLG